MRKIIAVLACGMVSLLGVTGFAQTKTISGVISGSDGEILVGATAVSTSGKYSIAEVDGTYSLAVRSGETVTFSCFGYEDVAVTVSDNTAKYDVVLPVSAATMLEETVVIGYGTTTKKEVTGSVTSLKMENLDKGAFSDASAMLQGKVAGLSITNPNGGDPNGSMEILRDTCKLPWHNLT